MLDAGLELRTHGARRDCCTNSSNPCSFHRLQSLHLSGMMRSPRALYHHSHHSENVTLGFFLKYVSKPAGAIIPSNSIASTPERCLP